MGANTMGEARHINTVPEKFNVISDNVIGGNHQIDWGGSVLWAGMQAHFQLVR